MTEQIQILVDQIVAAVFEEKTSVRKRYYLQQSLLSLAQAAYLTGIQDGRRELIKDINNAEEKRLGKF
jgi:hypothetical protein